MRNWKVALAAAALVAPAGILNAVSASDNAGISPAMLVPQSRTVVAETEGQGWGCCWVLVMGRWMCVPC